jgi:hypothetical protein
LAGHIRTAESVTDVLWEGASDFDDITDVPIDRFRDEPA